MITLSHREPYIVVHDDRLPGGELEIHYLEAFCRSGSAHRTWGETIIPHETVFVSSAVGGSALRLRSTLEDGVVAAHVITGGRDAITFFVTVRNPTDRPSAVHWAQPCVRVGRFTGTEGDGDPESYIGHCFVFVDGELTRLPTQPWAVEAPYTPGQEYCPRDVPRDDVGPRPLSEVVPSNGLIGCVSGDGSMLLATAWHPCQMLFQGVKQCIHADFRIGGLAPGEMKRIKGRLYLLPNDPAALLRRYAEDFPDRSQWLGDGGVTRGAAGC